MGWFPYLPISSHIFPQSSHGQVRPSPRTSPTFSRRATLHQGQGHLPTRQLLPAVAVIASAQGKPQGLPGARPVGWKTRGKPGFSSLENGHKKP